MKLCVISHTEHYVTHEGVIVGWGPTISEINHLTTVFDEIYHVAMLHKGDPPPSALPYISKKITFISLPVLGGRTLSAKVETVLKAPKVITIVNNTLKKVDYFQLRVPTGIGVYLIPYLTLFKNKKGWFKYAGNWNQNNAPLGYAFQRFMLKKQKRQVTINGKWVNQPSHCNTFENPCLSQKDLENGIETCDNKNYKDKLSFCFVGRLETPKGVARIIDVFSQLSKSDKSAVGTVHMVGEGPKSSHFKKIASNIGVDVKFHGALPREEVFNIYRSSHVFLLPTTASEGFPKVIAEALNFGCIPVVSNISSICQYINNDNGFIVDPVTDKELSKIIRTLLHLNEDEKRKLINSQRSVVSLFTFSHYNNQIKRILKIS